MGAGAGTSTTASDAPPPQADTASRTAPPASTDKRRKPGYRFQPEPPKEASDPAKPALPVRSVVG